MGFLLLPFHVVETSPSSSGNAAGSWLSCCSLDLNWRVKCVAVLTGSVFIRRKNNGVVASCFPSPYTYVATETPCSPRYEPVCHHILDMSNSNLCLICETSADTTTRRHYKWEGQRARPYLQAFSTSLELG